MQRTWFAQCVASANTCCSAPSISIFKKSIIWPVGSKLLRERPATVMPVSSWVIFPQYSLPKLEPNRSGSRPPPRSSSLYVANAMCLPSQSLPVSDPLRRHGSRNPEKAQQNVPQSIRYCHPNPRCSSVSNLAVANGNSQPAFQVAPKRPKFQAEWKR